MLQLHIFDDSTTVLVGRLPSSSATFDARYQFKHAMTAETAVAEVPATHQADAKAETKAPAKEIVKDVPKEGVEVGEKESAVSNGVEKHEVGENGNSEKPDVKEDTAANDTNNANDTKDAKDAKDESEEKGEVKPAEAQGETKEDADEIVPNSDAAENEDEDEEKEEPLPTLPPPKPDTPAHRVLADLGEPVRTLFQMGSDLVKPGAWSTDMDNLKTATVYLVRAFKLIPDEKSTTAGYGELALAYARALLGFVSHRASDGGVLGGDVMGALKKGKVSIDGEPTEEDDDLEEEESDEMLCWEQLELARVAFEKSGMRKRLGEVLALIGDFLLICDQATMAGEEFEKAAQIYEGREKAECLYKVFLALRKEKKEQAVKALKSSLEIMKGMDQKDETLLKDMQQELELVQASSSAPVVTKASEVRVQTVTPKRKRAVVDAGAGSSGSNDTHEAKRAKQE